MSSIEHAGSSDAVAAVKRQAEIALEDWHYDRTEYGWAIRDGRGKLVTIMDDARHVREEDAKRIASSPAPFDVDPETPEYRAALRDVGGHLAVMMTLGFGGRVSHRALKLLAEERTEGDLQRQPTPQPEIALTSAIDKLRACSAGSLAALIAKREFDTFNSSELLVPLMKRACCHASWGQWAETASLDDVLKLLRTVRDMLGAQA